MTFDAAGFVKRLHTDSQYRSRFAERPAEVLSEAGVDPEALALPGKIDEGALAARLAKLFANEGSSISDPIDVTKYSIQELWDRHGAIGWRTDLSAAASEPSNETRVTVTNAAAIVIYGASIAVSVVSVGGRSGIMSVDELAQLRALSRQPADQLTFSVTGPDGTKVEGITSDMLRAFLGRLK